MSWMDDMARVVEEQQLILIGEMLEELKLGSLSEDLKTAIKAHDDLVEALGLLGAEAAPRKRSSPEEDLSHSS